MPSVALIVPFFNERFRLKTEVLLELSQLGESLLDIYLIDDGSTDDYSSVIRDFISVANLNNIKVIKSNFNRGKAEAIRYGANQIDLYKYALLGITDADFSAPPSEIARLARLAIDIQTGPIFGVRKTNESNFIQTSSFRFIQGVIFNRIVTGILGHKFMDSQCGLKFFQVDRNLVESLKKPFLNPWLFDLEILLRLNKHEKTQVNEIILKHWSHVNNSKTSISDVGPVAKSLILLRWRYGKLRLKKVIRNPSS